MVEEDDFIIYGGNLEAAIWVSRSLANGCQRLENPREAMLELWNKGMELGQRCQWIAKQQASKFYPLRFQLVVPDGDQNIKDEALPLSKAIPQIDKRLGPVSRAVANIVHEVYGIVNYVTQLEKEEDPEVLGAAQVVMIAAAVRGLYGIVLSLDDSLCQYAFHLSTFIRGKGSIREFLANSLSEGVAATPSYRRPIYDLGRWNTWTTGSTSTQRQRHWNCVAELHHNSGYHTGSGELSLQWREREVPLALAWCSVHRPSRPSIRIREMSCRRLTGPEQGRRELQQ